MWEEHLYYCTIQQQYILYSLSYYFHLITSKHSHLKNIQLHKNMRENNEEESKSLLILQLRLHSHYLNTETTEKQSHKNASKLEIRNLQYIHVFWQEED